MGEHWKQLSDALRSNEAKQCQPNGLQVGTMLEMEEKLTREVARRDPIVVEPEWYRTYFDLPDDLKIEFTRVAEGLLRRADDGEWIDNVAGVAVNASLRLSAYHGETEVVALARAVVLLARQMDEMFRLLKRKNETEFVDKVYPFIKPR